MKTQEQILKDFKILDQKINQKRLVYLDNAATTQKPISVIEAISNYYKSYNANPHRGAHTLSIESTKAYEDCRAKVAQFINAKSSSEIIFTKNTTESLNLVAYSYAYQNVSKGDEIVICISEHHSNLIPWQQVCIAKNATLKYMYVNKEGILSDQEIDQKITEKTKIVCIAHATNTYGVINPVEKVIKKAHQVGAIVVIDAAQSIPHMKEDVQKLDCDFMAFSGHKMLAPMGVGVLYGKTQILANMKPFMYGGDMIEDVKEQETTYAELPFKFEAGTQNVEAVIGLSKAIDYINEVGYDYIQNLENKLTKYTIDNLSKIPNVIVYGPHDMNKKVGVVSFNVKDVHPHDVATILDSYGIAIRSGHHCAEPFLNYMGLSATCRASFYLYNTLQDTDVLIDALKHVRKVMGYES